MILWSLIDQVLHGFIGTNSILIIMILWSPIHQVLHGFIGTNSILIIMILWSPIDQVILGFIGTCSISPLGLLWSPCNTRIYWNFFNFNPNGYIDKPQSTTIETQSNWDSNFQLRMMICFWTRDETSPPLGLTIPYFIYIWNIPYWGV